MVIDRPVRSVSGTRWRRPPERSSMPWWTMPWRRSRPATPAASSSSTVPCSSTPARTRCSTWSRLRASSTTESTPSRCSNSDSSSPAGPAPTIPTWVRMRLLLRLEEGRERVGFLMLAFDVGGHAAVEVRESEIHLLRLRILADEVRDLLHLADKAVGLVEHLGHGAVEVLHEVGVAALKLGAQLCRDPAARGGEHHHRAQRSDA